MYYRVTGYKKNDDLREMIIRAKTKEDAKKQIPAAKLFLFPGENTDDYYCNIFFEPLRVNDGTTLPYFKITVERPETTRLKSEDAFNDGSWWEMVLSADNEEDAKAKGREGLMADGFDPDNFDFYVDEMTVDECIKEEERSLRRCVENTYLHLAKKDNLPMREFVKFRRQFDVNNNPEQYYEALKSFNKFSHVLQMLVKTVDQETCTVKQFMETLEQLYTCQDKGSFETTLNSISSEKEN